MEKLWMVLDIFESDSIWITGKSFIGLHKEEFPINSKIQGITSKAINYLWKPHDNTKLQLFILFSVIQIYKQQGKKQIKQ